MKLEVSLPSRGAWIEIVSRTTYADLFAVAPFTGAWIEIIPGYKELGLEPVAPFTGSVD